MVLDQTQAASAVREDDQNAGMVQTLQPAVNTARKAGARVKKVNSGKTREARTVASMGGRPQEAVCPGETTLWQRAAQIGAGPCSFPPGRTQRSAVDVGEKLATFNTADLQGYPTYADATADEYYALVAGSQGSGGKPALIPGQATRLRPFPPPLGRQPPSSSSPHVPVFGSPKASHPYMFVSLSAGDLNPNAIGGVCTSPPNGPPKPPKNRTPLKEVGKSTGPIHPETGGTTREAVLEAKREALAKATIAQAPGPAVQFVLQDDDSDTGQQPSAEVRTQENNVMD